MLNIFYQNKTLNDTLIINVSLKSATQVKTISDVTFGYNDKELVFINIANASNNIDKSLLVDGLLFPTKELVQAINLVANLNIIAYMDNGFKVATIEQCEDIKGTHLHNCKVNIGGSMLDIVCGAPNARAGLKTVCATIGTMLPDGKLIVPGSLLGNKSNGMLCSYRELHINKESKGIIELNDSFQNGQYFLEAYKNTR